MKVGEYEYAKHGNQFRIYRCSYADGKTTESDPVDSEPFYREREAARKRVYELNGWKYKPKK